MALSASYMRRLNNDHTKSLLVELDALLPQSFRSKPARNGAGARAMVRGGRSMNDVLSDIAQLIKHTKSHPPPALPPSSSPAAAVSDGLPEEAILFYAHGLLCVEVEMGAQQSWKISRLGLGASRFWGAAPWGTSIGHSLSQLVHRKDFDKLEGLRQECCSAPGRSHPRGLVRLITFSHQRLGGRRIATARYEKFELQLHMCRQAPAADGDVRRVLVVGTPWNDVMVEVGQHGRAAAAGAREGIQETSVARCSSRSTTCSCIEEREGGEGQEESASPCSSLCSDKGGVHALASSSKQAPSASPDLLSPATSSLQELFEPDNLARLSGIYAYDATASTITAGQV